MSVVLDFLNTIYDETNSVGGKSWQNVNSSMYAGLKLAIEARFKFEKEDFAAIANSQLGFRRWAGDAERFYAIAVKSRNTSACVSFEHYQQRKPFIFLGQRLYVDAYFCWNPQALEIGRQMAENEFARIGVEFDAALKGYAPDQVSQYLMQQSKNWWVTSFSKDQQAIHCCSYYSESNPYGDRHKVNRPTKLIKLTVADLKLAEKVFQASNQLASAP